jgi:hypothetical protein
VQTFAQRDKKRGSTCANVCTNISRCCCFVKQARSTGDSQSTKKSRRPRSKQILYTKRTAQHHLLAVFLKSSDPPGTRTNNNLIRNQALAPSILSMGVYCVFRVAYVVSKFSIMSTISIISTRVASRMHREHKMEWQLDIFDLWKGFVL